MQATDDVAVRVAHMQRLVATFLADAREQKRKRITAYNDRKKMKRHIELAMPSVATDMGSQIITMGPTMTNPDALGSVHELRQELWRANSRLLQMTMQLDLMSCSARETSVLLARIVRGHMTDDHDAVKRDLDAICAAIRGADAMASGAAGSE